MPGSKRGHPALELGPQSLGREFTHIPLLVPTEIACPCSCPMSLSRCCVKGHYWGGPERSRTQRKVQPVVSRPGHPSETPLTIPHSEKVILYLEATSSTGTSLIKNAVVCPTNSMLFFRNIHNKHTQTVTSAAFTSKHTTKSPRTSGSKLVFMLIY